MFYRASVHSIRVVEQSFVYKSMGLIYLNKFTYLNTFMIKMAHKCSDNGGPTVNANILLKMVLISVSLPSVCMCLAHPNRHPEGPFIIDTPWSMSPLVSWVAL